MNTEMETARPLVAVIESAKIGVLPTPERSFKGGVVLIGTGRMETLGAMVEFPLLLDRLHHKDKRLNEDQHRAGVRITELHDIAMRRNGYGKLTLERLTEENPEVWEKFSDNMTQVNAVDLYHKTMQYMTREARRVVSIICFEQRETHALYDVCFGILEDSLKRALEFIEESLVDNS